MTTQQIVTYGIAAVVAWFLWRSGRSEENGILATIKRWLGGSIDPANTIIDSLVKLMINCPKCSPEEEAEMEAAAITVIRHIRKHYLTDDHNEQ